MNTKIVFQNTLIILKNIINTYKLLYYAEIKVTIILHYKITISTVFEVITLSY